MCIRDSDWVERDDAPVRKLHMRVEEIDRHVPATLALELIEEYADQTEEEN